MSSADLASSVERVLIVGPSWLGDMIMAQSLFKSLNKQGKKIDVLAPKWNHAVLECMPEIDRAIELPFEHGEIKLLARYKFAKKLKQNSLDKNHNVIYQECIVIPNSFKSCLIPYWMGIPIRTGWLGEFRYGVLNNHKKLDKKLLPYMVQRLVALSYFKNNNFFNSEQQYTTKSYKESLDLKNIDFPELIANLDIKNNLINKYNLNNKKILILAPGAAYGETKKWPEEYFSQVAEKKLQDGWQIILLGSINDRTTANNIINILGPDNNTLNLTGKLALPETVAIISLATAIISNDSGLLHVAAGLNISLIGIYGSTTPDFTPPLISENKKAILSVKNLSCKPCFKRVCKYGHLKCLKDIKPELVLDKLSIITK